jgi:hypothetical protein
MKNLTRIFINAVGMLLKRFQVRVELRKKTMKLFLEKEAVLEWLLNSTIQNRGA